MTSADDAREVADLAAFLSTGKKYTAEPAFPPCAACGQPIYSMGHIVDPWNYSTHPYEGPPKRALPEETA